MSAIMKGLVGEDNDPQIQAIGGGTYSLSTLKRKALREAEMLLQDIQDGKFRNSAYNVNQLANTLKSIASAEEEELSENLANWGVRIDSIPRTSEFKLKKIVIKDPGAFGKTWTFDTEDEARRMFLGNWEKIKAGQTKYTVTGLDECSFHEGAKVDRMAKHIAKSERDLGKSKKDAENIAWATLNKRGELDEARPAHLVKAANKNINDLASGEVRRKEEAAKADFQRRFASGKLSDAEYWRLSDPQRKKYDAAYDREIERRKPSSDQIWRKIEDATSNYFPDGDPYDAIWPWAERNNVNADDIEKACKKHGYSDIWDYWDVLADDLGANKAWIGKSITPSPKGSVTESSTFTSDFKRISWEQFERLQYDSSAYEETEIDGKFVIVCYSNNNIVIAVYYQSKGFGSYNDTWFKDPRYKSMTPDFFEDPVTFVELDPNWPWK